MKTMSASEVSRNFASVLDQAEHGETIVVTRGGKRLATIAPAAAANGRDLAAFLAGRVGSLDGDLADDIEATRELLALEDPWND